MAGWRPPRHRAYWHHIPRCPELQLAGQAALAKVRYSRVFLLNIKSHLEITAVGSVYLFRTVALTCSDERLAYYISYFGV